ncbi:hypothetical protein B0H17DRAFT_1149342 [Mycena rosella]|uniref:Uncharacterized protein n=1 Tax=Mycena rosella TaxID=1033263 RepID=A0AAD7C326_MYCRO|nr:hypothetical protein B0H17DRAFT_1149342 [Mycena rosella]
MDSTAERPRERSATGDFKAAQRPRTPCGMRPVQDAGEMSQRQWKRNRQEACARITVLRKDDRETEISRGVCKRVSAVRPSSAWAHLIGSSRREGAAPTAHRGAGNSEREEKSDGSRENSRRNGEPSKPQHQGVQSALHTQRAADARAQHQVDTKMRPTNGSTPVST